MKNLYNNRRDPHLHCPAIPEPAAPCCGIWDVRRTLAPGASAGECRCRSHRPNVLRESDIK